MSGCWIAKRTVTDASALVARALAREDVALHLLARLGARAWLLISPLGWADTPALRALLGAFVAYDLVLAVLLHRRDRPALAMRWGLDCVDVACWAALCPAGQPYTAAVVVAVPTLVATTVRRGPSVGAGAAVGLAITALLGRQAVQAQLFVVDLAIYPGMAVVLGAVLIGILRSEAEAQHRLAHDLMGADLHASALAGRNDVITGVGSDVIDVLQASIMQLTQARVGEAAALRASIGLHKQGLAERTRREAMYLRDALDGYAREVRADEPAVARHVFFEPARGAGAHVLTGHQADLLHRALAAAAPRGTVPVVVRPRGDGGDVVVRVGDGDIELVAAAPWSTRLSVGPVAMVGLTLYVLTLSHPDYADLELAVTAPIAAVAAGCAAASHVLQHRFGRAAAPWLAVGILVLFLSMLVIVAPAATASTPTRLTLLDPLPGLALVLAAVADSPVARAASWTGLMLAAGLAIYLGPRVPASYVVAELIWPLVTYLGARWTARTVHRLSRALSSTYSEERRQAAAKAREHAAASEVSYLLTMVGEGRALCAGAAPGPVRSRVEWELDGLRARLSSQVGHAS